MTEAVPDASALLALRLAESGAEKVRAVPADAAVSAVNFGEIVGHCEHNGVAEAYTRLARRLG